MITGVNARGRRKKVKTIFCAVFSRGGFHFAHTAEALRGCSFEGEAAIAAMVGINRAGASRRRRPLFP